MSRWLRLKGWSQAHASSGESPRIVPAVPILPVEQERATPPREPASRREMRDRVRTALGPAQPVEDRNQLLGREQEIAKLFDVTLNLRAHALVYGARGSGKTSLVRAFGDYADEQGMLVVYQSCGVGGSFASIFRPYLDDLPDSSFPRGEEAEMRRAIAALPTDFDARALAAILVRLEGPDVVLIVDEYDRVHGEAVRGEIAGLVKLLSDMRASVFVVFVGIARNVHELIEGHASLRRHLVAVRVRPFDQASVARFFDQGEADSGLIFPGDVRQLIAPLAGGSPYHLRLFAMHAALAAIRIDAATLTQELVVSGLRDAFANWSSVNPAVAALFEREAMRGARQRRLLVALGRTAIARERFSTEDVAAIAGTDADAGTVEALLEAMRSMLQVIDSTGSLQFDDPLAPQFLLLSCCLAEQRLVGRGPSSPVSSILERE